MFLLLFMLLVGPASAAPDHALNLGEGTQSSRRVALVIGNGAYANAPALPNPPKDAKAIAAALRDLGFEVIEAEDQDQRHLHDTLAEFADRLEGADAGLFFYAGHGLQVAGENYLVPVDARLERQSQIGFQAVRVQAVLDLMEAAVPIRLVLLDACRDNPLARTLARGMGATRSTAVGQGLAEVRTAVGTLIAYATAPGQVALDGNGEHSPFTAGLLEHIGTPGLEVRQVLSRVRGSVLDATRERQVPWDSSSLRGDYYLRAALSPRPEPALPPFPAVSDREAENIFWQSVQGSSDPADFEAYLERYKDGTYVLLARNRLTRLRTQQEQRQAALPPLADQPPRPAPPTLSPPPQATIPALSITPPSPPPPAPPTPAVLETALGLTRADWQAVQRALTALGFDTKGTEGRPGPATRKAIAAWQTSGRHEATGYLAGPQRGLILGEAAPKLAALEDAARIALPPETQQAAAPADAEPAAVSRDMAALPPPSGSPPVTDCDRLAAAPGDKAKVAEGVSFEALDAVRAVPACEDAVRRWPREPRLAFQYGRALQKRGDDTQAVVWYRKAADQGNAYAQNNLGRMYANGLGGLKKDDVQAIALYRKAADQGDGLAQFNVGNLYWKGSGVPKDDAAAVSWFRKGAEQGNAKAQYGLGWMYMNGQGVSKDDAAAAGWYRKAAEQGNTDAQNDLGVMYMNGRGGLPRNEAEGLRWYRKAAEQGNAKAQDNLGVMYIKGQGGLSKDDAQAVAWFRKAAEQGYANGQYNLGIAYRNGEGGLSKDDAQAVAWYRKAAEQGSAPAQNDLGVMYMNGRGGLPRNEAEGLRLYRKAADAGNDLAKKNIKEYCGSNLFKPPGC